MRESLQQDKLRGNLFAVSSEWLTKYFAYVDALESRGPSTAEQQAFLVSSEPEHGPGLVPT